MNARSHIGTPGREGRLQQNDLPAARALGAYLGGMALTATLALILAGAAAEILKHAL
ncbi:hypothetical protein [Bosea sp. 685]|uniref:hypothetical protein n=1 Tax=Bosea sp. 685 TaxID=3080057 RepID=UPI0028935D31|nr:hypothetical protein [Bosea sp. 685]WNJ91363.1 hypothetical protein RMR04_03395 [Bosea sp. 685]